MQATHPHKNERSGLNSCLFFIVLRESGQLTYDGATYILYSGDCVFIDCKKLHSHETGNNAHQEQVDTTIDATNSHNKHCRPYQRIMVPPMVSFLRFQDGRYLPQISGAWRQTRISDEPVKFLPRHLGRAVYHRSFPRLCQEQCASMKSYPVC